MEACARLGKSLAWAARLPMAALACLAAVPPARALDNGLARTPPMGWNAWNCFQIVDENTFKEIADAMVASGMKDAGYQYCNIDGGWWTYADYSTARNADGTLRPRPELWPSPMKSIGDYVHGKGLKFGHYSMPAQLKEVPGTGNIAKDAQTFASWGVDYLKFDGWSETPDGAFTEMRDALKATGRPVVFSVNGNQGAATANLWRTSGDIGGTWESMYGNLGTAASGGGKPGAWLDPDMLLVGNTFLDFEEEKSHFSGWCVASAPLIAGNDLRAMTLRTKYILLNTEAIAVDQDTAANDGKRIKSAGTIDLWAKTLKGGAKAVLLINTGTSAANGSVAWSDLGLSGAAQVRDLWEHADKGPATNAYAVSLPAHGCAFLKITPGSQAPPAPSPTWFPKPADPVAITALDKTGWTASFDGFAYDDSVSKILDGKVNTRWAATPQGGDGKSVIIDMQAAKTFNTILIDGTGDGTAIPAYETYGLKSHALEVFVSPDKAAWGTAVWQGPWGPHNSTILSFPEKTARYIKLVNHFTQAVSKPTDEGDDQDRFGFGYPIDEIYVAKASALAAAPRAVRKGGAAPGRALVAGPARKSGDGRGDAGVTPGIRYYRGDGKSLDGR